MKSVIKKATAAILIMAVLLPAGCAKTAETGYPATAGGVTLKAAPSRIVCLSAAATATVKQLAGETVLVGVCDSSKTDGDIPRVGDSTAPDTEKIVALSCDLIISNDYLPVSAKQALALSGIPVAFIPAPVLYEELSGYYTDFATLLFGTVQAPEKAENAMSAIDKDISFASQGTTEPLEKALILPKDGYVATPDTLMGHLLSSAGFENSATGYTDFTMSDEAIAAAAPDIIFCDIGMHDRVASNPAFAGLPAVVNSRVFEIDVNSMRLPGKGLAEAIAEMYKYSAAAKDSNQSASSSSGE